MYETHPRPGLTYVWLLNNTIDTVAKAKLYPAAVNMWIEGLLPLVTSKQYSAMVAQCGKDLARSMDSNVNAISKKGKTDGTAPKRTKAKVAVSSRQLIALLEVTYAPSTQIPRNINKQLIDTFSKLKTVCCSSAEGIACFKQLLPRLVPSCSPGMAQQIASVCEASLQSDTECWQVWLSMLPKHLTHSSKLLRLMGGNDHYSGVFATDAGQSALKAFDQISASRMMDNTQARDLNRELKRIEGSVTVKRNKERQNPKGRSSSFIWRLLRLVFWLGIVFSIVGYTAVYLHSQEKQFQSTTVGKLAAKYGATEQTKKVIKSIAGHATSAYK